MIKVKKDSVSLSIGTLNNHELPFLWLRDNCQCDDCRIIETEEKQFLLHTVPLDISPKSVEIKDKNLYILWPDDHQSVIPLRKIEESSKPRFPKHKSWEANFTPKKFEWSEFLNNGKIF